MGGHRGGSVAAWLTAHHIARSLGRIRDADGADEFALRGHEFVSDAGIGLGTPEMGAAFAALILDPDWFGVANVGDCRVYRISEGVLAMLSVDDVGPSRSDSTREVLTQSVGGGGRYRLDAHWFASPWPPEGTHRFVLASDGLAVLDPTTVAGIASGGTPASAASTLVSAVLKAGAPDNATVIVVDVHPLDGSVDRTDAAHADG
jgi:protein phosphatase